MARRRRLDGAWPSYLPRFFINTVTYFIRGVKDLLGLSPLGVISCLLRGQVNLSI